MDWQERASGQGGVITRRQLTSGGAASRTIGGLVSSGRLLVQAAGVYLVGGAPVTDLVRLWVAALATEGALGFATAAGNWGVDDGMPPLPVHVAVAHSRRVYPPSWVRVHRVPVAPHHLTHHRGLPTTSLPWTLCDYLPTLRTGKATRIADRALQQGWITADDIAWRLRKYPRRRGNPRLRALLALTGDGAAAQSERVLHALLRRAGLTGWVPNHPIVSRGRVVAIADVAFPALRIAIEIDGMAYHTDVDRFQRDRSRQNDLVTLGWTVLRFTWADLTERPHLVIATILRAAAA